MEKTNEIKNRKATFKIADIATHVLNNVNTTVLSEEGKVELKKSIWFKYPFNEIIVEELRTYDVARDIVINVQKELVLMTYSWYGEVMVCIEKYLRSEIERRGEEK
jgi:hypothetical protein